MSPNAANCNSALHSAIYAITDSFTHAEVHSYFSDEALICVKLLDTVMVVFTLSSDVDSFLPEPPDRLRCSMVVMFPCLKSFSVTSICATFAGLKLAGCSSGQRLAELVTPLSLCHCPRSLWEGSPSDFSCLLVVSSLFPLWAIRAPSLPFAPTNPQHPLFWFCLRHLHKRVQRDCRDSFCVTKQPQLCITRSHYEILGCI